MKVIIDGGYLSWVYGTRPYFGNWDLVRFRYQDATIFMDSRESWRTSFFPEYKGRRIEKRQEEEKAVQKARIEAFRDYLRMDPVVPTLEYSGAEADDLIALSYLQLKAQGEPVHVIGIDKDYQTVPGLRDCLFTSSGSKRVPTYHLPMYLQGYNPDDARDCALVQALYGDRSDSIPRIHEKGLWNRLVKLPVEDRFEKKHWPDHLWPLFTRNLKLVLLPGLFLRSRLDEDHDLPGLVASFEYWDPAAFEAMDGRSFVSQLPSWQASPESGGPEEDPEQAQGLGLRVSLPSW